MNVDVDVDVGWVVVGGGGCWWLVGGKKKSGVDADAGPDVAVDGDDDADDTFFSRSCHV